MYSETKSLPMKQTDIQVSASPLTDMWPLVECPNRLRLLLSVECRWKWSYFFVVVVSMFISFTSISIQWLCGTGILVLSWISCVRWWAMYQHTQPSLPPTPPKNRNYLWMGNSKVMWVILDITEKNAFCTYYCFHLEMVICSKTARSCISSLVVVAVQIMKKGRKQMEKFAGAELQAFYFSSVGYCS